MLGILLLTKVTQHYILKVVTSWVTNMSIAKDILIDEYKRLKNLLQDYLVRINKLPKGCIRKRIIKKNIYYYLAYRLKDKIKYDYIGKKESEKYNEIKELLLQRKKLSDKISEVKQYIKELSKYVNE